MCSGPVRAHRQHLCGRPQQVHVHLFRSLSGKLMSGKLSIYMHLKKRIYKISLFFMVFFSYCLNPFFLLFLLVLLLLLSGSVESILLYRHPDSGLCCGSGLLLRDATRRYTNLLFCYFLFYYLLLTLLFMIIFMKTICVQGA